jgi:hypothetical protein
LTLKATAIAWNVNFDPRVAVTCPVSRTFEASFDFIFFDWDMFFLSLMAGTAPAATSDSAAFDIAISNLIETAQTRSVYGQVMNKRAASGASTSDTNDRTEPLVGAMVTHRMWQDAARDPKRKATMQWVVELLYPTLLGWNQWALGRQYGEEQLLVLGQDNNLPCEGSTVGLNTSVQVCQRPAQTILESGMDNSPMYLNAFPDPTGKSLNGVPADWDQATGRLQVRAHRAHPPPAPPPAAERCARHTSRTDHPCSLCLSPAAAAPALRLPAVIAVRFRIYRAPDARAGGKRIARYHRDAEAAEHGHERAHQHQALGRRDGHLPPARRESDETARLFRRDFAHVLLPYARRDC